MGKQYIFVDTLPPPPIPARITPAPIFVEELVCYNPKLPTLLVCAEGETYSDRKACTNSTILNFVYKNIRWPHPQRNICIEGFAVINFEIGKDGKASDFKIVRNLGGDLGEEALRVVRLLAEEYPEWDVTEDSGVAQRWQYNLPVKFKLE